MSQHCSKRQQVATGLYKDLLDSDVRLLKIHAGDVDNIECNLEQLRLDEKPDFYALSYVWGDLSKKKSILVNSQQLDITENLYDALHHLRRSYVQPGFSPFFWIDAICINQGNIDERSRQVTRMTDIYTMSRQVVIWLGSSDEESDYSIGRLFNMATGRALTKSSTDESLHGFTFGSGEEAPDANEIFGDDKFGELQEDDDDYDDDDKLSPDETMALTTLLGERPWFSRIWTVQEACLGARDPILWAGRHCVAMQDLVGLLVDWTQLHPRFVVPCYSVLALARIRLYLCHTDDPVRGGARTKLRDNSTNFAQFFLELLCNLDRNRATDPLDQLYGLLGLVGLVQDDELPEPLRPDYETKTELAYENYATFLLNQTGDLRLLDFTKSELEGVPSWVTDFRYLRGSATDGSTPCRGAVSVNQQILSVQGFMIGTCDSQIPACRISDLLCMETRKLITSSCLARFRSFEKEILSRSANLRQTSIEATLDHWLSFIDVEVSQPTYQDLVDRLETEKSAFRVRWLTTNELSLLDCVACGWLVLANGTIVKMGRMDAKPGREDLVCLFKGSPIPSVVRKAGHQFQFVCSGDIIDGLYGPGVRFDETFWDGRDQAVFELI